MTKRKTKKKLNWFKKLMLWLNLVLAACTLLSYLSPVTDPRSFWPIAFFGLAYPIMLPAHALLIIYWCFAKPKFSLLSIVTLLLGWPVLTRTIGFRLPEKSTFVKPNGPVIRVLTYNVHYFRKFDDFSNSALTKEFMLSTISGERPDVICLQEVMTRKTGEFDNIASLKKMTGMKYYYFVPNIDNSWEAQGLAIFSRFPILKSESIVFPNTNRGNEAMSADVMAYGKRVRIYNVHFQSISFQPEDYKYLKEVKDIQTDDVKSSRRIMGRLKRAFLLRSEQVELVKARTLQCEYPFIIAGDFNDTPGSYALNHMAKGLKNAFREKGSGPGITYNGEFPNFQIDYILASPDFNIESYRIVKKKLSDHYAVRSDVRMFAR
jgi:endonuclease/exonuclease/phosphatase family metal-dependent hydrolase